MHKIVKLLFLVFTPSYSSVGHMEWVKTLRESVDSMDPASEVAVFMIWVKTSPEGVDGMCPGSDTAVGGLDPGNKATVFLIFIWSSV